MTMLTRRILLAAATAATVLPMAHARAAAPVFRVGYQKYGNLILLKESGLLEGKLKPLGTQVEWKLFISGPAAMEALGAGAIDVAIAGETPPVFAQAAQVPVVYLASEPPAPKGEAILVLKDSPIRQLSDLKGKKVGFNKGSNVHYLYVKAVESAGLKLSDVNAIYLNPADGRAAFERGSIDAWVAWDPFLAAAQATGHTRVLADGTGLVSNHQFYLGRRGFQDRETLRVFLDAIAAVDVKTAGDLKAAVKSLVPATSLPDDVLMNAVGRQAWDVKPMDPKLVADQQAIADTFFRLGLIPKKIDVASAL